MHLKLLLLILVDYSVAILVKVKHLGKIEGSTEKSLHGKAYYSFEGIPYAAPPIGPNRFSKPKLPQNFWTGILKAKTKYTCLQLNEFAENDGTDPIIGQEDCLYLNIYTPSIKKTAKLPVIFFIHGGGFQFGSGAEMGAQFLMDHNVVYVNFNYRLGILGFLSTEDDVVPGNMGMWDQIAALKFIKKYIRYFGGDSTKITLYGMSAGAVSVHFHYVFKQSWSLFQRGFSQSGCMFNPWALMENSLEKTKTLAAYFKCPTNSSVQMINCLREKPGHEIVKQLKLFQPWLYNPFAPFGPIVDNWAKTPLLPKHPYQLIQNGEILDVPWLTSFTNSEGLDPGAFFYPKKNLRDLNTNWVQYAPHVLDFNFTVKPNLHKFVAEKIYEKYLGTQEISQSTFAPLLTMLGDRMIYFDVKKAIDLQNLKTKSSIYLYYYSYRGAHSTSEYWSKSKNNFGASHGDDTGMMLQTFVNVTSTPEDREMQRIMTNLLVSFAKTGEPQVKVAWPAISKPSSNTFECLKIENPKNISMGTYFFENEDFWNSLPIIENEKLFEKC